MRSSSVGFGGLEGLVCDGDGQMDWISCTSSRSVQSCRIKHISASCFHAHTSFPTRYHQQYAINCELYCMLAACACSIHSVRHESLIRDFEHAWHTSACADRSVVYAFFPPSIRPSKLQDVQVLCRCLPPEGMHIFVCLATL